MTRTQDNNTTAATPQQQQNASAPSAKLVRHDFDSTLLLALRDLQKASLDNWHGPLELLEDYVVCLIFATIAECVFPLGAAHVAAYAGAVLVIGCRMRGLAEVHHQAAHRSFARHSWLNYLGAVFGGWPVLQSFSIYYRSHCVDHHAALGDAARDPDYQALLDAGLYGSRLGVASLLEYLQSLVSVRGTLAYLRYLAVNRVWSNAEAPAERVARACFYATVLVICARFGWVSLLVRYWLVPMTTTACWVGSFIELSEHYPLLETSDPTSRTELALSRNRICGRVADFFLGIHGEGYHLVHHLFPRMPQWACREAHELLMAGSVDYRSAVHCHGWGEVVAHMLTATATATSTAAPMLQKQASRVFE
jgi:fatty acid desaturase